MGRALNGPPLREVGLRFALALVVLLAAGHFHGGHLVQAVLPVFRAEIGWLERDYRVLDLSLAREGADRVIALEVGLAGFIVLGRHALYPDPRARARVTTLAGHVLTPAILSFALAAAWRARRKREYPLRFAIALPLAFAVMLLDVPFVLLGEAWNIQVAALEPDRFSPILVWKDFLQGGGRFVLGLMAGVIAIALGNALTNPQRRAGPEPAGEQALR